MPTSPRRAIRPEHQSPLGIADERETDSREAHPMHGESPARERTQARQDAEARKRRHRLVAVHERHADHPQLGQVCRPAELGTLDVRRDAGQEARERRLDPGIEKGERDGSLTQAPSERDGGERDGGNEAENGLDEDVLPGM